MRDLAGALDASLAKAAGAPLEASREEARLTAKAFVPLVRRGLIEGVYGSDISDVPPSKALQEMMEKRGSWVNEAGSKELAASSQYFSSTSPTRTYIFELNVRSAHTCISATSSRLGLGTHSQNWAALDSCDRPASNV